MVSRILSVIGGLAVGLTMVQFIPQVIKAYKSRQLQSLSVATFLLVVITATTWIVYGVLRKDLVVITANALVLGSAVAILIRIITVRNGSKIVH